MGYHCAAQVGFALSVSLPPPARAGLVGVHHPIRCPFLLSLRVSSYKMELRDMSRKVRALQRSLSYALGAREIETVTIKYLMLRPLLPSSLPSSPLLFHFLLPPPFSPLSIFSFVVFTEYLRGASKNCSQVGRDKYVQRLS